MRKRRPGTVTAAGPALAVGAGGVAGDLLLTPLREAVADLAGPAFIRRVRIHPTTDAGPPGAAALTLGSTP